MPTHLRRRMVALATALACITIMASPASATAHSVTFTSGTLAVHNATSTSTLTFALAGAAGAGCGSSAVVDVVPDGTGHAGTIDVTSFSGATHFTFGTPHYVSTISRTASTSGTWGTSASGTISSATLAVNIQIRAAANNSSTNVDCATTGNVLCTWRMTFHLAGTYANGPLSTAGATVTLATTAGATITLAIGTCQVPFFTWNGGSATVTGLTGVM